MSFSPGHSRGSKTTVSIPRGLRGLLIGDYSRRAAARITISMYTPSALPTAVLHNAAERKVGGRPRGR